MDNGNTIEWITIVKKAEDFMCNRTLSIKNTREHKPNSENKMDMK